MEGRAEKALPFVMVTAQYKKYLRSPAWQKKREAVFLHYGKRCYACRTTRGPIQVHHLDYSRLYHEQMSDLLPLCIKCHKSVTKVYKSNRRRGLRRVTMEFVAATRAALKRRPLAS